MDRLVDHSCSAHQPTSPKLSLLNPRRQPSAFQQYRGAVIGLGDRALESKVRVPWTRHTRSLTPARDCSPRPHAPDPVAAPGALQTGALPKRALSALDAWLHKTPLPVRQHPERADYLTLNRSVRV